MSGIIFFKTQRIDDLEKFYTGMLDMSVWLRQEDCIILRHQNLLLGFCTRAEADRAGMITIFYTTRQEVDVIYDRLKEIAGAAPEVNEKYRIYHFFAQDPEKRVLEFQCFLHPVDI